MSTPIDPTALIACTIGALALICFTLSKRRCIVPANHYALIQRRATQDMPGKGRVLAAGWHILWPGEYVDARHGGALITDTDVFSLTATGQGRNTLSIICGVSAGQSMATVLPFASTEQYAIAAKILSMIADGTIMLQDAPHGKFDLMAFVSMCPVQYLNVKSITYETTSPPVALLINEPKPVTPRGQRRRSSLAARRK